MSVLWVWNIPDLGTGNRYPGTGSDGYFGVSNASWLMCQLSSNYMGLKMSLEEGELADCPIEVIVLVR